MAAYSSGSQTDPGSNYTPDSGTDTCLVWVVGARRNGTTTASGQDYGGTGMTEPANQDQTIDIAGGADPTANLSQLVNPGTSSAALTLSWSVTPLNIVGFAMTLTDVDQTTPVYTTNGPNGGTYTSATAPSLSYDAPADSVVVYWRLHAQAAAITWTDPTNFTQRSDIAIITSPANRNLTVWTRDVTSAIVSGSVAATSNNTGDGVHGVCVFSGNGAGGGTILPQFLQHLG